MQEIWDNYVDHSLGERKQAEFKFKQFEYNYKKYFPRDKSAQILDVGIGRGEMLSCIKDWGYTSYKGVDISLSAIEFCRSLGLNCERLDNVTGWLKEHKDKFSFITLLDVLEHIKKEETIPYLKALRESLKEDGVLLIQVPNLQAPDGQLTRYHDFTHEVGYVEHSLKQVLMAAGFEDIKFFGFEQFVFGGWKEGVKKIFRMVYWKYTQLVRTIIGHLKLQILHPVFYAVVRKG